jgi:hypothetical protein
MQTTSRCTELRCPLDIVARSICQDGARNNVKEMIGPCSAADLGCGIHAVVVLAALSTVGVGARLDRVGLRSLMRARTAERVWISAEVEDPRGVGGVRDIEQHRISARPGTDTRGNALGDGSSAYCQRSSELSRSLKARFCHRVVRGHPPLKLLLDMALGAFTIDA